MDDLEELLELQDEVMEEDYGEEPFDMPPEEEEEEEEKEEKNYEQANKNEEEMIESSISTAAPEVTIASDQVKKSARDIDMIGFQATLKMNDNTGKKQKTPQEFAKYMQEVRMATIGESDAIDKTATCLFILANQFMYEVASVCKLSLREVAGCTSIVPQETSTHGFCPMVLSNGRRIYLSDRNTNLPHPQAPQNASNIQSMAFDPYKKNLLNVSYHELTQQVDILETQNKLLKHYLVEQQLKNQSKPTPSRASSTVMKKKNEEDNNLWVDKYAPNSFTQLLSAEKTNRDVMKALKRWDRFVFKKDNIHSSHAPTATAATSASSASAKTDLEATEEYQKKYFADDGRPRNKVILLCGPPGTGKTTLAHVAAVHCGYRPVEVNASDDRSPESLKEMLARATQNATLDNDKRPNCIIFDEIDGMDGNKRALEMLLEVIRAPLMPGKGAKGSSASSQNKKTQTNHQAKSSFALTRPLICICNDQYAPVLRELRRLSDIFVFALPTQARLTQRLKHICHLEQIDVSRPAILHDLIAITGQDIRSTINNLQFAAMKAKDHSSSTSSSSAASNIAHGRLDLSQVIAAMMQTGLKDDQLDSYQVWQRIFTAKMSNSSSSSLKEIQKKQAKDDSQMMQAIDAMLDHGDYDHLLAGIHENLLPKPVSPLGSNNYNKFGFQKNNTVSQVGLPPPPPPSMGGHFSASAILSKYTVSCDWLSYVDTLQEAMRVSSDGFQLMPHVAVVGGVIHFCHATIRNTNITNNFRLEWPKKDKEVFYQRQQRVHVLETFQQQSLQRVHATTMISKQAVSVDCVSALMDIISPRVRPMPMPSLSQSEKAILTRVIQVMESCGVAYTPLAVADEQEAQEMLGGIKPMKRSFPTNKDKNNNNNGNIFLQDNIVMVLEPNLSLLLRYPASLAGSDTLRNRHRVVPPELRNILYTEQRKYAIAQWEERQLQKQRESRPNNTTNADDNNTVNGNNNMDDDEEKPFQDEEKILDHVNNTKHSNNAKTTHAKDVSKPAHDLTSSEKAANPWERPGHEAEEEAKRAKGSLSSFLVKRPAATSAVDTKRVPSSKKPKLDTSSSLTGMNTTTDVNTSASSTTSNPPVVLKKKSIPQVVFKFNQGYSNAVRRPVYLRDFVPLM